MVEAAQRGVRRPGAAAGGGRRRTLDEATVASARNAAERANIVGREGER